MKKNIVAIAIISIFALLAIPILIVGASEFTGIGKKEGGFKTYPATSIQKEGQDLISKYKIKCVAKDVDCIMFIETKRGETFFAYNVDHNNYYFYEDIKYEKVPEEVVAKYQIVPQFTWLEINGKYFDYAIWVILGIFGLIYLYFQFIAK